MGVNCSENICGKFDILNLTCMGGGCTRSYCGFCPLLKKLKGNRYLKILDFSKLFVADAPMRKKIQKFCFTTTERTYDFGR